MRTRSMKTFVDSICIVGIWCWHYWKKWLIYQVAYPNLIKSLFFSYLVKTLLITILNIISLIILYLIKQIFTFIFNTCSNNDKYNADTTTNNDNTYEAIFTRCGHFCVKFRPLPRVRFWTTVDTLFSRPMSYKMTTWTNFFHFLGWVDTLNLLLWNKVK